MLLLDLTDNLQVNMYDFNFFKLFVREILISQAHQIVTEEGAKVKKIFTYGFFTLSLNCDHIGRIVLQDGGKGLIFCALKLWILLMKGSF